MSKVLFFAHLRDAVGQDSIELEAGGKSVAELKQYMTEHYQLQKLDSVMVAINEEFASDDEIIKESDTVAFIPPVSGG
jgi:sulfur-carrier protein